MEFKSYTKEVEYDGRKLTVNISVEVQDDDPEILLDQDFETPEQRAKFVAKIENGELFSGCIIVKATAEGLEGLDSLVGCELTPNNMFNSAPFNTSVEGYLTYYSLEDGAVSNLISELRGEARQTQREHLADLAPELLEALKRIREAVDANPTTRDRVCKELSLANIVIAKAEGGIK